MQNEFDILNSIEKNNKATQRDLARSTGLSLGSINILIKRLIRKGLVKVERISPRTIRYMLTPNGIKQKAEATYKYIISSYKFINDVNYRIDNIIMTSLKDKKLIVIFGPEDEICQLLSEKLRNTGLKFSHEQNIDGVNGAINSNPEYVNEAGDFSSGEIVTWNHDYEEILTNSGVKCINLMEYII